MYKPLTFFTSVGAVLFVLSLVPFVRFLILIWFTNNNGGAARHLQSIVIGSVVMIAALITLTLGVIADLIRINRILIEDSLERQKREQYRKTPFTDLEAEPEFSRPWLEDPTVS
jgi:hypothetical protein